jgi:hypothetical protein
VQYEYGYWHVRAGRGWNLSVAHCTADIESMVLGHHSDSSVGASSSSTAFRDRLLALLKLRSTISPRSLPMLRQAVTLQYRAPGRPLHTDATPPVQLVVRPAHMPPSG